MTWHCSHHQGCQFLCPQRAHMPAVQALVVLEQALNTSALKVGVFVEAVQDLDLLDLGNTSKVDIQHIVHEWPAWHPLLLILGLKSFLQQLKQLSSWQVELA